MTFMAVDPSTLPVKVNALSVASGLANSTNPYLRRVRNGIW